MNWINCIKNNIKKFFNKKYYNNTHIIDKKNNNIIDKKNNNINIFCDIHKIVYNDPKTFGFLFCSVMLCITGVTHPHRKNDEMI